MVEGIFGIAVLTEDEELFNRAAFYWRSRIPSYVYVASDGPSPVPLPKSVVVDANVTDTTLCTTG